MSYYWKLSVGKKYDPSQPRVPPGSPEGGRWTNAGGPGPTLRQGGNVSEHFKAQRQKVEEHLIEYQELRGLGPCGPCAEVAVRQLRGAGFDARPAACLYQYGKHGALGGHYVAVVMDNAGDPWFIVDNSNFFQDDARVMVARHEKQWNRFVDLEWGRPAETVQEFADVLWGQEDFDWWANRL